MVDAAASIVLLVLGLAFLQNVARGTAGEWLRAKFLNSGAPPVERPDSGIRTPPTGRTPRPSDPGGGNAPSPGGTTFSDPLPSGKLVGVFGDPRDGGSRSHKGIDLAAPSGTPIRVAGSGKVVRVSQLRLCGKRVAVAHGDGWETIYCHLRAYAVSVGDTVRRGQIVGYNGATGNASGPHLHFEIRKNGNAVNPAPLVGR